MSMKLEAVFGLPAEPVSWLVLPMWEDHAGPREAEVDELLGGMLSRLARSGDLTGKAGDTLVLHPERALPFERLLLVGLGKREQAQLLGLGKAAYQAAKQICSKPWARVALMAPNSAGELRPEEVFRHFVASFLSASRPVGQRQAETKRFSPETLLVWLPKETPADIAESVLRQARVQAEAVLLARELVNLPPNELYPETFAARAVELGQRDGFAVEVLEEEQLRREKMGALLGVAQGSARGPRVVVLRYGQGDRALGLVGKGVTFDSGGLSLKPSEGMLDMKCDMAGAAAVLAAVSAVARLRLPVKLLGILALVENMPSGTALKLGDILTARNGKTIEIHNTDAEGRLILADALDYAVSQGATHLVDLATLTGACLVALGTDVAGLFGNQPEWLSTVRQAIATAGERAWELPLFKEYADLLKSHFADLKNIGGKHAGAITAAKFLEQFVGTTPWCHLDIAGPAWASEDSPSRDAGGTGCFVPSLIELSRKFALPD